MTDILYAISFFLSLGLAGTLWWVVARYPEARRFWGLLALAWTMNLVADLAWGVLTLADADFWLDWIDYLYFARYGVIFLAFWLIPRPWGWKPWIGVLASLVAGGILVWLLIARPVENPDPAYALAGMVFPILDAGLVCAAWYRWQTAERRMNRPLLWVLLGMATYGAANWFNYHARIVDPEADSVFALAFWLLATLCVGIAVRGYAKNLRASIGRGE